MKYGKQVNDLKLVKKIMLILSLICTLVCLSGCDLWYQDLKGYMEHWSESVQVSDVSVQASPEIQKNSSGVDTIATYATVEALVNIINPENYSLDGGVGSAEENLRSVRIAGSAGASVLPLANVTSMSSTVMEIQIAPLAQVLTKESLAVEHTNFTVTFVPTRTENGLEVAEPRTITLRYNTPPRSPIELVYDSNQGKITWLGSDKWDIVQGSGSDLDDLIFWAWPSGITDPTHPDYVERFEVYEDGDLFDSAAAADFLMSKESSLQSYIPQEIKDAGYDIYCSLGTSGKTITVCAVDSEGVRSQMATSGIAPHKVILEANGGFFPSSGLPSVETYKAAGSPIVGSDLEVPFQDGYFLSGWTSNGSDISFPLSIDEPMTLVAQWTPYPADGDTGGETGGNTGSGSGSVSDATYSITYNANGADSGTVPASQTKLAGKMVSLAKNNGNLTKEHHTFSGWNTAADGTGTSYAEGASYTLDASITLYAQWTRWNQVEPVQFDVGAGNVNFNTQVTLSTATPNATIHYTVNGSGEQIGSAGQSEVITIASDATITAYGTCDGMIQSTATSITYKLNTYTVSYDGNGSDGGAVPGVQSFTSGSSATVTGAGTMTRTGYTFTGWNTAADGSGTPYVAGDYYSSDANLTLYAHWQINTYTVTFDGNNHTSGATTSQNFTYGVPQNLNANGFQRTGYTFTGWNTAANGSGASYAEGARYTATGDITLYAQWNLNQDVDGKYIISDHTHLLWIAEKLKVGTISKFDIKLTADIVIPSNTWEPIDVTYSSIDGQGHSITLTEDFTDLEGESFGLFGVFNYGTVENLVLKGSITAQVEPGQAGVGAVSGSAYRTIFRNVMSEMKIINTGTGNAGGLVGYFGGGESNPEDALIESCAVYADVTSSNGYAGGLVGATWGGNQPWTIRNSIYIGTLSGKKVGGIVGVQNTTHPNTIYMSNLYYCTNAIDKFGEKPGAAIEDVSNVMSKTQDEIKNEGVNILGNAWELKSGGNYPTLIQP